MGLTMNSEIPGIKKPKFDSEKLKRSIDAIYDEEVSRTIENRDVMPSFQYDSAPVEKGKSSLLPEPVMTDAAVPKAPAKAPKTEDREELLAEIDKRLFSNASRLIFCLFTLVLLIWIETGAVLGFILPVYISLSDNLFGFLITDSLLLLAAGALCGPEIVRGAAALFRFRPDSGSLAFVAFFGAAVNDVYLLFNRTNFIKGGIMIYSSVAAAVLVFCLYGRAAELGRAKNGLKALPRTSEFYRLKKSVVAGGKASATGSREDMEVLVPVKGSITGDYLKDAFEKTPPDYAAKILSPSILAVALVIFVLNLFLSHGLYMSIASFAAVCCISAPVMFGFGSSLTILRVSRRLRKRRALITGWGSVAGFEGTESIVADAGMIFPPEMVAIHAIKTFSGVKIEKAILDAASVVNAADGPLKHALRALISEESRDALEKVEKISFRDDLGLQATIDKQRVLLGNRDLIRSNGIETPSREYEAKYAAQGRDVLYLAAEDKLSAMFIAGYYSNNQIASSLKRLDRTGISLLVRTTDANITPSLIADRLSQDYTSVKLLDSRESEHMVAAIKESADTGIAFSGSIRAYVEAVIACIRLRSTINAITVVQTAGAVLGAALIAYCTFVTGIKILTPVALLEYQGIWALPPLMIAFLRRN